jgi:hypothetical protein
MPDHRYLLPPDPAPSEVTRGDGSTRPMFERIKPASPIAPAPTHMATLAEQLAAANETIGILRDLLNTTAAALTKLAETISLDTGQAAVRGALRADELRRFS